MRFDLTILGCHSASPGKDRFPSAQVLNIQKNIYLIDCGEATQIRMLENGIKRSKISKIFISHLHGDHVFGLAGFITSISLFEQRPAGIDIFSPPGLEEMIRTQLRLSESFLSFELRFHVVDTDIHQLIFEDNCVEVFSIPLKHRISTTGFLFKEKKKPRKMLADCIEQYEIPYQKIKDIKNGADFLTKDNKLIPNAELTLPPIPPRSFAYCSDTVFKPDIIPIIQNVDLLYHESTFLHEDKELADKTMHSTAREAAEMATLANVKCLIIGHFSVRYKSSNLFLEEAQKHFPNTVLGESGRIYKATNYN